MEGDGAGFGKERQAGEGVGGGGGVGRKCWVKSDRNGIEGKLLAAEGRVEVAAAKKEKIKKKEKLNGDMRIGTGGFQTATVIRLRPHPSGEEGE